MFSHVLLGTSDVARAGRFYDALLAPLGFVRGETEGEEGLPDGVGYVRPGERVPTFYAHETFDGQPPGVGNGTMVAFLAPSREAVDAAYAAAMKAGGTDEGPPGDRPRYGLGYYGAYLRDPDGNKVHVVHRGDIA